jgi:hypothetical protein
MRLVLARIPCLQLAPSVVAAAFLAACNSNPTHTSEAAAEFAMQADPEAAKAEDVAKAEDAAPGAAAAAADAPARALPDVPAPTAAQRTAGVSDLPAEACDPPILMQVGSTIAFVFERPDPMSKPVARMGEGAAVDVVGKARFVRMETGAPMHEGFPGETPPTWVKVRVRSTEGWMPARSLIGVLPLALDSRGLAAERAALVGVDLSKDVRNAWDAIPGTPQLSEANYEAADAVLADAADPHDLRMPGRDAFTHGPDMLKGLPEVRTTVAQLSKVIDGRAGKVRAAATELKMPPYDKNAPGNLKEALKVGIGPKAAAWKMVNALEYLWFNSRFLTPVEERVIGRECLAALIGSRRVLPQDDPSVRYVTWVLGRVAAQSTTPMPAFGLAVAVVRDDASREAEALPGGPVMVTTGLLRALRNEHELATVMGQMVADSESLVGVSAAYSARADRLNAVLQVFELQAAGALEAVVEEYLIEVPEDHTEQAVYDGRDRLLNAASERYVEIMRGTVAELRAANERQREYAARRGAMLVRAAGWTPVDVSAAMAGGTSEDAAGGGGASGGSAPAGGAAADQPARAPRANPGPRWTRFMQELDRDRAAAEEAAKPKPAPKATPAAKPGPAPKAAPASGPRRAPAPPAQKDGARPSR